MPQSLRHAAGSLLVAGLAGTTLTPLERSWLRLVRPGGTILFRRNIENAAQSRAMIDEASALCSAHPFACVDLEGGSVDRLRDALAPMPAPQAVAQADRRQPGKRYAFQHGQLVARAVRAFGFNTTLAPVVDLGLPVSAKVMGSRTAGASPRAVIAFAKAFLAGLAHEQIAGCAKHFPGLGGGTLDSHHETPSIDRSWRELWAEDLAPYRELSAVLPMAMVNHAAYPRTPGKSVPASISRFWMTTVLRQRIGYHGLIFSDDFEMGGILNFTGIEEATLMALRAGIDTIEICHSPELILRAYEAILRESERSAAFRKLVLERARAVAAKRKKLFASPAPKPLTARQFEALRGEILRFGDRVAGLQPAQESA